MSKNAWMTNKLGIEFCLWSCSLVRKISKKQIVSKNSTSSVMSLRMSAQKPMSRAKLFNKLVNFVLINLISIVYSGSKKQTIERSSHFLDKWAMQSTLNMANNPSHIYPNDRYKSSKQFILCWRCVVLICFIFQNDSLKEFILFVISNASCIDQFNKTTNSSSKFIVSNRFSNSKFKSSPSV